MLAFYMPRQQNPMDVWVVVWLYLQNYIPYQFGRLRCHSCQIFRFGPRWHIFFTFDLKKPSFCKGVSIREMLICQKIFVFWSARSDFFLYLFYDFFINHFLCLFIKCLFVLCFHMFLVVKALINIFQFQLVLFSVVQCPWVNHDVQLLPFDGVIPSSNQSEILKHRLVIFLKLDQYYKLQFLFSPFFRSFLFFPRKENNYFIK